MDHSRAPVLDALVDFRNRGDVPFGPPGHRQGRGVDQRVLSVLGEGLFASDVLMMNGLDDRRLTRGHLELAQELMADAVGERSCSAAPCGSPVRRASRSGHSTG